MNRGERRGFLPSPGGGGSQAAERSARGGERGGVTSQTGIRGGEFTPPRRARSQASLAARLPDPPLPGEGGSECAARQYVNRTTACGLPYSRLTMSNSQSRTAHSVPAARLRPGHELFSRPDRGAGGAPTGARVQRHPSGLHMTRQARRLRSALRPSAEGRAPLGAPPWRFSASGPRFRLRHCLRRCVQRAPRSTGHSARRAVSAPPEPAVTSRSRGTPSLAPPTGLSPETPLDEQGWRSLARLRLVVNINIRIVATIRAREQ